MSIDRIKSGIPGLDKIIGGGIPKGRSCLIAGEPGTGKTTFALQYLLEGAKENEKAIYIAIDEKPEHIIDNCSSLGWNLSNYLENGSLEFLDVSSYFGSKARVKEDLNIDRIVQNIMSFVTRKECKRLVIDPISPLILSSKPTAELTYYIRKTIFKAEENTDCTTLMTSPIPTGTNQLSKNGIEEYMASGIILLKSYPNNQRYLSVKKMRGTAIDSSQFPLKIEQSTGISVTS